MASQGAGVPCSAQVPARIKQTGRVVKFERTNAGVCKGPGVAGSVRHPPRGEAATCTGPDRIRCVGRTWSPPSRWQRRQLSAAWPRAVTSRSPTRPGRPAFSRSSQGEPQSGKLPLFINQHQKELVTFRPTALFFFFFLSFWSFSSAVNKSQEKET